MLKHERLLLSIYGPCGVMACTLGIFFYINYIKAYIGGRSSNLCRTVFFLLLAVTSIFLPRAYFG
jgi:hypothetical protein